MTGNEAELIERLIVEAAKRGAVELQLERAVRAGEEAANNFAAQQMVNHAAMRDRDLCLVEEERLRVALSHATVYCDKAIAVLRELFVAVRTRKSDPKGLHKAVVVAANVLETHVPF